MSKGQGYPAADVDEEDDVDGRIDLGEYEEQQEVLVFGEEAFFSSS